MSEHISLAVIKRLPKYYRYLGELLDMDITKISSKDLSEKMGVTASQIRQDLNNFGSFGLQGYGYNIELLYSEIGKILGIDRSYKAVIVGFGNIGQALVNHSLFSKRGVDFICAFDKDQTVVGTELNGIKVEDISGFKDFLEENEIDIVTIAVPKHSIGSIEKILYNSNVKGVWNFSNCDLNSLEEKMHVENVNLMDSLMTLSYKMNEKSILEKCNVKK